MRDSGLMVASGLAILACALSPACTDDGPEGNDEIGDTDSATGTSSDSGTETGESSESADTTDSEDSTDESTDGTSESTEGTSESTSDTDDSDTADTTGDTSDTDTDTTTGPIEPDCVAVDPPVAPADCVDAGILLAPEFEPHYECFDLGNLPGVPSNWGGLTVMVDDPYTLLIGGSANTANGMLYEVEITRDEDCHITGWAGTPIEPFGEAAYNDGGVTYGPDDVLFLARWPNNELGQQLPGSMMTDKIIDLDPFGVVSSPGGLNFVPPGFAGEGQLKLVSWSGGQWYTLELTPDGNGTFDIADVTMETTIVGGPEGFVHISAENEGFPVDGLLVSEWSAGNLAAYDADDNGDPLPNTRRDFVTGLTGAEGAYLDHLSGDFLFTTFGGGNRLVTIRGFTPNPM